MAEPMTPNVPDNRSEQGFPNREEIPPLNVSKISRNEQQIRESAPSSEDSKKPPVDTEKRPVEKEKRKEEKLDKALVDTFPASDPAIQP